MAILTAFLANFPCPSGALFDRMAYKAAIIWCGEDREILNENPTTKGLK
jgi:hypothetical protein